MFVCLIIIVHLLICRKTSHESVDIENVMARMTAARREEEMRQQQVYEHPQQQQQHSHRQHQMVAKMLSRQDSGISNFSKHVESERYKGVNLVPCIKLWHRSTTYYSHNKITHEHTDTGSHTPTAAAAATSQLQQHVDVHRRQRGRR